MRRPEAALIVLPTGLNGGAESVAFSLVRYLQAREMPVILYVMSRGMQPALRDLAELPGVTVVARGFSSEKTSLLSAVYSINRLSREWDLQLAYSTHLHVNAMLGLMRKLGLLRCRRLVARESTVIFDRFFGLKRLLFMGLYRSGYGPQDLLIGQTPEMLRSLALALGYMPVREQAVIPNPIDPVRVRALSGDVSFASDTEMDALRRRRIVACGRAVPIKGFVRLIEAFARVSSNYPNYDLEIVGDGPEMAEIIEASVRLNVSHRVLLHGHLSNPYPILSGADVGVISSEREGFPNVLLEMMACGVRRIVSTPCASLISEIPGVVISEGVCATGISKALGVAMGSSVDNSSDYMSYLQRVHSLQKFGEAVLDDKS